MSDDQRYPALRQQGHHDCEIYIENSPDLSASMRRRPYNEIYDELWKGGAFNLRMIDGSLIQLLYKFRNGTIASHRLCVFPSPTLEIYEDAQEAYEEDQLFADIVARHIVRFPIRFDFSNDDTIHIDMNHPKSHMTLGQYTNCRIPVASPLTPSRFMRFVLRNFYYPAFERFAFSDDSIRSRFDETITDNEKAIGYFSL